MKSTDQRPDCSGYRNRIVPSPVPHTRQDAESWPQVFFLPLRICISFRGNQGKDFPVCQGFVPAGDTCLHQEKALPAPEYSPGVPKALRKQCFQYCHTCLRYHGGSRHRRAGDDQGLCGHLRCRVRGQRQPRLSLGLALALPRAEHCSLLSRWTSTGYCRLEQVLSTRRGHWYLLIFILEKKLIFTFKKTMQIIKL